MPSTWWRANQSAHPHVRGEDEASGAGAGYAHGSPPRAWGGRKSAVRENLAVRLTPTCVGRTSPPVPGGTRSAAHPHVRGEDDADTQDVETKAGSPPRAWGGRLQALEGLQVRRLTPTCVGRTGKIMCGNRRAEAHPHVRGEDSSQTPTCTGASGSPPRAWGGHRHSTSQGGESRLTPTCVGRTLVHRVALDDPAAHPHVRGEDSNSSGLYC